jgi:hypothetical protein
MENLFDNIVNRYTNTMRDNNNNDDDLGDVDEF